MTRLRSTLWRALVHSVLVSVLGVGILVAAPSPAFAAPGDAFAIGLLADLDVEVVGGLNGTIDNRIGEVTAPPDDTASLADVEVIVDLGGVIGTQPIARATAIETAATSGPTGSAATAQVTDATINTPLGLLTIDAVGSEVSCPTGGTPTADVTPPATVTLGGTTVALDLDGETVIGPVTQPRLGTATLTLTVDQTTTTTETAAATAFVFGLEQDFPGIVTVSGTMTLAQTSCEAPLGPTATALDPDSGPTTGGTEVTVTGTGFVPGETTVTIGGNTIPADEVDVADDGTSLTFETPPHVPGTVDVTVTTPGGTTEPLDFTYFANPTATALDPDSGPTTGNTEVTITGTGFVPDETTVTIGGNSIPAGQVDVADDGTTLTFTTPRNPAGTVEVTVTTPGGTTEPRSFLFIAAADDDDDDDDGDADGDQGDGDEGDGDEGDGDEGDGDDGSDGDDGDDGDGGSGSAPALADTGGPMLWLTGLAGLLITGGVTLLLRQARRSG